jgi:methyl-accepting chemotaxis protein
LLVVARALRGEMGVAFALDYRDVEVLSAYSSLPVGETSWAVMAEMDKLEILEQATSQRPVIAGFMLFFYSLGIWSAWFIQRAQSDGDGGHGLADLDMDFTGDFRDG